ncbi:hypothetical protein B0T24DRAFT_652203 [Lasiosphaeria ovina]|uniref:DUF7924 domain-containing protein n=1 Tax=Lasiosphaeria ovina TaxID=92902 RepID=A0AAE0JV72_9PEZI|nr:hypothetical protein B0T24DRAFT_652203 [Lasiosphaeria ovina]
MARTRAQAARAFLQGQPPQEHAQLSPQRKGKGKGEARRTNQRSGRGRDRKRRKTASIPDSPSPSLRRDLRSPHSPIAHWVGTGRWPRQPRLPVVDSFTLSLLARQKRARSRTSRAPESNASAVTTDSDNRRAKPTAPYGHDTYRGQLGLEYGSQVFGAAVGLTADSLATAISLLQTVQPVPAGTLFGDDVFEATCLKIQGYNDARLLRDITPLLVPSAETLYIFGNNKLELLVESTSERWDSSIPLIPSLSPHHLTLPPPQPDYSVGFRQEAFTDHQRAKLSPFIGNVFNGEQSFFMATRDMCFPFLTCEVKCGESEIARRQNAYSMTIAVRAVVSLFRLVRREEEVDRQILAFSLSHNEECVNIFGHYAVLDGKDTKYYSHHIRYACFTNLDLVDRWTAYQFVKNVYETWAPEHLARLRSAIDQLPEDLDQGVAPPPEDGLVTPPEDGMDLDVAPLEDGSVGS